MMQTIKNFRRNGIDGAFTLPLLSHQPSVLSQTHCFCAFVYYQTLVQQPLKRRTKSLKMLVSCCVVIHMRITKSVKLWESWEEFAVICTPLYHLILCHQVRESQLCHATPALSRPPRYLTVDLLRLNHNRRF